MLDGNFIDKLQDAKKMLSQMEEKLGDIKVEGTSGGGMVVAIMNGKKGLLELRINPEIVNPEDIEMLQDLIIAAIDDARNKVENEMKKNIGNLASGLGLADLVE